MLCSALKGCVYSGLLRRACTRLSCIAFFSLLACEGSPDEAPVDTERAFTQTAPVSTLREKIFSGKFVELEHVPQLKFADLRVDRWRLARSTDAHNPEIELLFARVPMAAVETEVRPVLEYGLASELFRGGPCANSLISTNGGFYIRDGDEVQPLGLVIVNGQIQHPASGRRGGGFLTVVDGAVEILGWRQSEKAREADFAIESTPVIIARGKNDLLRDDRERWDRVAIGISRQNDLLVVGSFGRKQNSISLWELEFLAREAARRNNLEIAELLALDGGPSAHIFLGDADLTFGSEDAIFIPNVICVRRRQ